MKRSLWFILLLSSLVVVSLVSGVVAESPSASGLLSNPGFEEDKDSDGAPDEWGRARDGGLPYSPSCFEWDSSVKESGERSVKITRQSGENEVLRWFRYVPVKSGEIYQVAVSYLTGEDFKGKADVMINGCGLNEDSHWISEPTKETAGKWRKIEFTFTPKSDGKIAFYLQHRGEGSIWYDNAQISPIPNR